MSGRKSSRTYYISNHIQRAIKLEAQRTGKSQNQVAEEWLIAGKRSS